MSCQATIPFASPSGAHLSFYWTMDEASGDRIDSTASLHWPLLAGTLVTPALYVNGLEINARIRGANLTNSPSIVISQATSKGVSYWFWVKVNAYGTIPLLCDLLDFATNNWDFLLTLNSIDGATSVLDLFHQKDNTHFVEITSPNLSWALGTWHMVACTYDKPNQTLNIYADSVLVATALDVLVYPDLTSSFWALDTANPIGSVPDFICDELGLCLNGAITQSQVTSLWNGGIGVTWPTVTQIVPYP